MNYGNGLKDGDLIDIAKVCHRINKAYCEAIGDMSQKDWNDAPEWQRQSAMKGVEFVLSKIECQPGDSHKSWLEEKEKTGWKFGSVKDPEKKEHPCMVPFEQLPKEQQVKDFLFIETVKAMEEYIA